MAFALLSRGLPVLRSMCRYVDAVRDLMLGMVSEECFRFLFSNASDAYCTVCIHAKLSMALQSRSLPGCMLGAVWHMGMHDIVSCRQCQEARPTPLTYQAAPITRTAVSNHPRFATEAILPPFNGCCTCPSVCMSVVWCAPGPALPPDPQPSQFVWPP